ncbi:MAG: glycosyltransferase, partial [Patescibacteria group bacterium]
RTKGTKVFGYVKHTEIPKIYRKADIFVSPSRERYIGPFLWNEEFFGYTLMEAQASGLPIAATRCGGIPEEVGEDNLLVDQNDPKNLILALKTLIKDDKLRRELGRKNRKRAEKLFDLKKQVKKTETEILKLL